jgi:hypothetical protein
VRRFAACRQTRSAPVSRPEGAALWRPLYRARARHNAKPSLLMLNARRHRGAHASGSICAPGARAPAGRNRRSPAWLIRSQASGFLPVPLQGTQTFRCPRALTAPTPRQCGHASSAACSSLDSGAGLLPNSILPSSGSARVAAAIFRGEFFKDGIDRPAGFSAPCASRTGRPPRPPRRPAGRPRW